DKESNKNQAGQDNQSGQSGQDNQSGQNGQAGQDNQSEQSGQEGENPTKKDDEAVVIPNPPKAPTNVKVSGTRRNVAYYTSWSAYARNVLVKDIDASLITHLNFAFANLNPDGTVVIGDSWVDVEKPMGGESWDSPADSKGHFAQLRALKKKYPHLKTLISVGGWTWSNNFSDVAADASKRKKFATSAVEFCTKFGFDGIDIDWEYPVEGGNNITHRKEDKQNFTKLLAEIRGEIKAKNKPYLLTIAAGGNANFTKNTEPKEMMKYLDFMNIMNYDYHGAWDKTTNHNTPLYANPKDKTKDAEFSVDYTIRAYLDAGVKPEDMNMGLAFYGHGWTNVTSKTNNGLLQPGAAATGAGFGSGTWEGGSFDYKDIIDNYIGKAGYKRYWDDIAKVPYLYNGTSFISYDDKESLGYKLNYAESKKLGGTMFWEFTGDKNNELQKQIASFYGNHLAVK
ncbi:MAG: glycoside hydrolase family 18 protein, partial [Oscillospiraceae bacterium]